MIWAALALALAASPGGDADPSLTASPAEGVSTSRWWLGAGGRNALGVSNPSTPDFGGDLMGGTWLVNEHLQPIVDLGWSRVFGLPTGLSVDAFRAGGELAAGWALVHGYLWLGGSLGGAVQTGWLHEPGNPLAWGAMVFASGLVQGRIARRLLIGVERGPRFSGPALQYSTPSGSLSILGGLRLEAGVRLGWILGAPILGR